MKLDCSPSPLQGAVLIEVLLFILEGVTGARKISTFSGPGSWPCNPKCDGRTYNPSEECCVHDTILPFKRINLCGPSCTYRPCFELCCPESYSPKKKFIVKLKVHGERSHCSSSPISRNCKSNKIFHGEDIEDNQLSLRKKSGDQP
ncbi:insulin growth factor-like family member isoform X1 [Mus musculus]|uniref:insulin growth factor-like family member isoform X1 n=1 Tax=Mus musculus TaxID=10090 RepID=UPI0007ECF989|nr:insulin growth factor-like family member isoform X1 [Mus musculus]|eukprot:XP_017177639.1 PREDICTED: insulin growth factor-like family member isoform X1 [Mus musculus]